MVERVFWCITELGGKGLKGLVGLFSAAVAAWLTIGSVQAQERLVLNGITPAGSAHSNFWREWAEKVNDDSNGTLQVEVSDGTTLANATNIYERVMDDVVQIGWAQLALVGGQFPLSSVTDLPFMSDGYEGCSVAAWRLYESGLVDAEYQDVVPLWFGCLGQNGLHFADPLQSDTDLSGLKIRVASKLASDAVEAANGAPLSMPSTTVYESLQRGTLDGAVTSWPAFRPNHFDEVTSYHLEVPVGATSSMFFMSKSRFDALPAEAQNALMQNSGEAQSRDMGEFIREQAEIARIAVISNPNQTVVELSEEERQTWEAMLAPLREEWVGGKPTPADRRLSTSLKEPTLKRSANRVSGQEKVGLGVLGILC